jgi:hypothetical protein
MTTKVNSLNIDTSTITSIGSLTSLTVTGNITGGSDLYVGNGAASTSFTNPIAIFKDTGLTYVQAAIVNSTGTGSADIVTYGNNGDDTQSWTDMGFTGNNFSDANYTVTSSGDGYLFVQGNSSFGGNLVLATGNVGTTKDIIFATGGFLTGNIKARLYNSNGTFSVTGNVSSGNVSTGNITSGNISTGALTATSNVSFSGANVSVGSVANLKITGGSSSQVLTTDGTGNVNFTHNVHPFLFLGI